jgi:hypothetical protein
MRSLVRVANIGSINRRHKLRSIINTLFCLGYCSTVAILMFPIRSVPINTSLCTVSTRTFWNRQFTCGGNVRLATRSTAERPSAAKLTSKNPLAKRIYDENNYGQTTRKGANSKKAKGDRARINIVSESLCGASSNCQILKSYTYSL